MADRICERCGTLLAGVGSRTQWCTPCKAAVRAEREHQTSESAFRARVVALQKAERERLQRPPSACKKCGRPMEVDRNAQSFTCFRCMHPSLVHASLGEFAEPGVWRFGPVVFDWDGQVSVARCEECSFSVLRFGERAHRTAINHGKHWHGHHGEPHRILARMYVADCAQPDCRAIITTSEDLPTIYCADHRRAAA